MASKKLSLSLSLFIIIIIIIIHAVALVGCRGPNALARERGR